jgi:uncharacterized cofD-like protein
LAKTRSGFAEVLEVAGYLLRACGRVVPVAEVPLDLEAVVDGVVTTGQVSIAVGRGVISKLRVLPEEAVATPRALEAIAVADQIVLGPGSLFTSVIAALVVPGMTEAINAAAAPIVYVCNLTTQDGETLGMDAADHLDALIRMTGLRPPSAIVAHGGGVLAEPPLTAVGVDLEALATYGVDVAIADLIDPTTAWPRHDPARLGAVLGRLI